MNTHHVTSEAAGEAEIESSRDRVEKSPRGSHATLTGRGSAWYLRLAGAVALGILLVTLPLNIYDRYWLSIVTTAGVFTLGAVSLNLLTGYLGAPSLGHAFFMAVGAYAGIWLGQVEGAPLIAWIPFVLLVGAVAGALTGPLALRLSGGHFLMVTLALVFIGHWIFMNWRDLTGGPSGRLVDLPLEFGPLDFSGLAIGSAEFSRQQSYPVLVWLLCLLAIVVVRNISRSRSGRAMRAVRDNEVAASAAGVSLFRAQMGAFIVSSAIAALCGALYAQQLQYLEPATFSLFLSIQFVVVLVIGGSGSTLGPILGGFFAAAAPSLLQRLEGMPFVLGVNEEGVGFTAGGLSNLLYAVLLVLFLLLEPRGLVKIFARMGSAGRRVVTRWRSSAQIGE